MSAADTTYQYYGGTSEGEKKLWADLNSWMHMQAVQWEPAGQQLLAELGGGTGLRVVDMGCGPLAGCACSAAGSSRTGRWWGRR